jgi:hypothetical protein
MSAPFVPFGEEKLAVPYDNDITVSYATRTCAHHQQTHVLCMGGSATRAISFSTSNEQDRTMPLAYLEPDIVEFATGV